jgi:hypothetical protein
MARYRKPSHAWQKAKQNTLLDSIVARVILVDRKNASIQASFYWATAVFRIKTGHPYLLIAPVEVAHP